MSKTELALSPAASFAWQAAAEEAMQANSEWIEPEHLFLGICDVEKFFSADVVHRLGTPRESLEEARQEWEHALTVFATAGLNTTCLRRQLRPHLLGPSRSARPQISRSQRTRQNFVLATHMAQERGAFATGLLHLLAALLLQEHVALSQALEREQVNEKCLTTAVLDALAGPTEIVSAAGPSLAASVTGVQADEPEGPLDISEVMDASVPAMTRSQARTATDQRLALLYELPFQFGQEASLDVLLQNLLARLVEAIPAAARGVLLVKDATTGELLLKAHVPLGEPAISLSLAEKAIREKQGFLWRAGEDLTLSQQESHSRSGMYAPLLWNGEALGVICVDHSEEAVPFTRDDLQLLVLLAHYAGMAITNSRLQEDLRHNATVMERLLTSFSPKIRQKLLQRAHHGRLRPGGVRSEVTILFSDVRGFTKLSAQRDAEEIVELLNDYFSALTAAIFRFDGTVDKFVGDAILAVFGSPEADAKQHEKAVQAALAMQAAMAEVNQMRAARQLVTCEIGIGVHCGEVLHGFVGGAERMEFTVIGDAVNRASRLCSAAQAGQILISPELHQRVWRQVEGEQLTIATKHEGDMAAYAIKRLKAGSHP